MRVFITRFLTVFTVAAVLQFSVAAKADIPMSTFVGMVNVGASLDTTYQYVFNCDNDTVSDCPGERGLYPEHNDFSIDAFTLSLGKEADASGASPMDKVGFRTDILFGEQAGRLGFGFNSDGDGAVSPYQAYISVAPSENFSIIAGQFATLAGWELIEAKNNTNISRSLLFYRIPFAHSGVRASYSSAAGVDLTFGISNGWDAVDDVGDGKTFEFQAAYSHTVETESDPVNLWLGATAYVGETAPLGTKLRIEDDDGIPIVYSQNSAFVASILEDDKFKNFDGSFDNQTRTLVTLVGSVTVGKFTFVGDAEFTWAKNAVATAVLEDECAFSKPAVGPGGDTLPPPSNPPSSSDECLSPTRQFPPSPYQTLADHGSSPTYKSGGTDSFFLWGVGGYLIYQVDTDTMLSLRAEYVDDSDAATTPVKLFEVTPTVSWKPFGGDSEAGSFETRFEYRWDRADVEYFPSDSGLEKDQHALLVQLLYSI